MLFNILPGENFVKARNFSIEIDIFINIFVSIFMDIIVNSKKLLLLCSRGNTKKKHGVRNSHSRFLLRLITAQFLGVQRNKTQVNGFFFVYGHHNTVQCEDSGVAERVGIFSKLCLHSADKTFCLSVSLCLIALPHTYIFL
jgi:hypothetical protein